MPLKIQGIFFGKIRELCNECLNDYAKAGFRFRDYISTDRDGTTEFVAVICLLLFPKTTDNLDAAIIGKSKIGRAVLR